MKEFEKVIFRKGGKMCDIVDRGKRISGLSPTSVVTDVQCQRRNILCQKTFPAGCKRESIKHAYNGSRGNIQKEKRVLNFGQGDPVIYTLKLVETGQCRGGE